MSIFDRMTGVDDENKMPCHQFASALIGLADGKLTRNEVEVAFSIDQTPLSEEQNELDFLIDTYQGISGTPEEVRDKRLKYESRCHHVFMLAEHPSFTTKWTKAEIQTWLTEAAS